MRVLVSGASRGLGLEVCRRLLDHGHRVAGFARSTTDEVEQLARHAGPAFTFTCLDAADDAGVAAHVRELVHRWGGLDALVGNAAAGQDALLAHLSGEEVSRLLDVNVRAPIMLVRAFVRQSLTREGVGRVVLIGSVGAQRGHAGLSVYSATKGAIESFARSLAVELRGRVLVNVVAPGFFASEMSAVLSDDQRATIAHRTPSGSLTTTAQVADVVCHVLEADTNMNGTVITLDGGASA